MQDYSTYPTVKYFTGIRGWEIHDLKFRCLCTYKMENALWHTQGIIEIIIERALMNSVSDFNKIGADFNKIVSYFNSKSQKYYFAASLFATSFQLTTFQKAAM